MPTAFTHDPVLTVPSSPAVNSVAAWSAANNLSATIAMNSANLSGAIADDDIVLIYDTSTTSLKTVAKSVFVAGLGGDFSNGGDNGALVLGTNDSNSLTLETNNTARMVIAAGGEITLPTQPAFLGKTTAQANHSSGNVDLIAISSMSKNIGSHFNNTGSTANGIPAYSFKAPVAGVYLFTCLVVISAKANATTRFELRYRHDNSSGTDQGENFFARPWIGDVQPGEIRLSYAQLIDMAANDSVKLRAGPYGGTATTNYPSWFSGHLVA